MQRPQPKRTSNTGSDPKRSCLHFGEKCKYFCVYPNQMKRLVCSLKLDNLLFLQTFHMEKMSSFLSPLLPVLFLVTSPSSFLSITGSTGEECVCVCVCVCACVKCERNSYLFCLAAAFPSVTYGILHKRPLSPARAVGAPVSFIKTHGCFKEENCILPTQPCASNA